VFATVFSYAMIKCGKRVENKGLRVTWLVYLVEKICERGCERYCSSVGWTVETKKTVGIISKGE